MPSVTDIDYAEATDQYLLTLYRRKRDQSAFTEIVSRYYSLVLGLSHRMLGCKHSAEDVLQATFLVLAKDAHKIRKRDALASWLYGVTFRIAARHVRRRASQHTSVLKDEAMVADDPLEKLCEQFEQQAAFEELHRLPEKTRAPMVMRYLQGKSNAEVAESLALSESAVEGRLKRGRNQLRMRLAKQGVAFVAAIATLDATKNFAKAEVNPERIAQTVEACSANAVGTGTDLSGSEYVYLAEEEIWKMTTRSILKNVLAVSLTTAAVAVGWSVAGNTGVNAQDQSTEIVLASGAEKQNAETRPQATTKIESNTSVSYAYVDLSAGNQSQVASLPSTTFSVEQYTDGEKQIKESLEKTGEYIYTDVPLNQVIADLADRHQIQVKFDNQALEDVGVDASSESVSCDLSGLRLKSGLKHILDELDLTAVVRDEVLLVTSLEAAEDMIEPRVYRSKTTWKMSPDQLIDVITSTVAPNSWGDVGGPGSIVAINGGLVISTSHAIHDQINELLRQIDRISQ